MYAYANNQYNEANQYNNRALTLSSRAFKVRARERQSVGDGQNLSDGGGGLYLKAHLCGSIIAVLLKVCSDAARWPSLECEFRSVSQMHSGALWSTNSLVVFTSGECAVDSFCLFLIPNFHKGRGTFPTLVPSLM